MGDMQPVRAVNLDGLKLPSDATFGNAAGSAGQLPTAEQFSAETTKHVADFLKDYARALEVASANGNASNVAKFDQRLVEDPERQKRFGTALADLKDLSVDISLDKISRNPAAPDRLMAQFTRTDTFEESGRTQKQTIVMSLDLGITADGIKIVGK